jgi:hypothetical protein
MNLDALLVEVGEEPRRDDLDSALRDRNLRRLDLPHGKRHPTAPGDEGGGATRAGADCKSVADDRPDPVYSTIAEGPDHHPVDRGCTKNRLGQRLDGRLVFGVEVDPRTGERFEEFVEPHDGLGAVDACPTDFGPGKLGYCPFCIGDTIETLIVEGQRYPVTGDMHVGLDVGESEIERVTKCPFGVLRVDTRSAPVGNCDRVADVEIWVDARHAVTVVGYGRFRDRC